MSRQQIEDFLKRHAPKAFTADEINNFLQLSGSSVYTNLRKLRPKCSNLHEVVELRGDEPSCPLCGKARPTGPGIRVDKGRHVNDPRRDTTFYFYSKGDGK